ncbi:protein translocase subunit SecD [Pelagibius litoralis]|uniref:Protein translocase subunit SecD n=1 Tax=Pelagibius litoralis TaxID=374515 RepID=A0A967EUQ9_9PROT|nr:protein translocase subunit SecD [Pelagibius litoralis]NIA67551.1 protein translocase subunit SecD [Pelagibius litoralis]
MVHFPRWQVILVILIVVLGFTYASPNLLGSKQAEDLPGWVPHQQVNLGLDLRGGSYLLIEVDLPTAFEESRENLSGELRSALTQRGIAGSEWGRFGQAAGFTLQNPDDSGRARQAIREIVGPNLEIDVNDGAVFRVTYSEQDIRERSTAIVNQAIEVIRRRIDETGTKEPTIQRHGEDRILIQLPGVDDPERIKALIGQTAVLSFRFVHENFATGGRLPPSVKLLPADNPGPGEPESYPVSKRVMVSGDRLVDAQATFQDGLPVVSFSFDTLGAKRFGDATTDNVNRLFAIVLDEKVISAPVIREPILGGRGVISGTFTVQEAQDLALLLRAGALPAPLSYLEERTVGPGLGADSILAGEIAAVLGLTFVVVFMAVIYGLFGMMASVALLVNLILLLAALSVLQATLTLPGIAGIVLTIGMAVDANVLIFERIREEMRNGRGPVTAVDAGYRRAFSTIMDSNLTTLIAASLLFHFGSGPIKGFAVTLALGLITSMFSAIMLTRGLVVLWLRQRKPQALAI